MPIFYESRLPELRIVGNTLDALFDRVFADRSEEEREAIKKKADDKYGNKDCAMYRDLRDLLARPDIDATLIATGPNWHATAAILQLGHASPRAGVFLCVFSESLAGKQNNPNRTRSLSAAR